MTSAWEPAAASKELRLEVCASENYFRPYAMYVGQTHRDPLLDKLLPALLYIKAVAVLDDALDVWLERSGLTLPNEFRPDLNRKLCYFQSNGLVPNAAELHHARKRRNDLAHEPDASCPWEELNAALSTMEAALVHLGLARQTGTLQYYSERSAMVASSEP